MIRTVISNYFYDTANPGEPCTDLYARALISTWPHDGCEIHESRSVGLMPHNFCPGLPQIKDSFNDGQTYGKLGVCGHLFRLQNCCSVCACYLLKRGVIKVNNPTLHFITNFSFDLSNS